MKLKVVLNYILQTIFYLLFIDLIILRFIFNMGVQSHFEPKDYYIKTPYAMYVGKDIAVSNKKNILYDKNNSFYNGVKEDDIKVAFFAGSTGLLGDPNLSELIEIELEKNLKKNVFLVNYSILAGTSRQHMHMLLEYLNDFKPDIIIYYNGFNEILMPFSEDPRAGYPYNQYYEDIEDWKKCLIKYSAICGHLEQKYGFFTKKENLRNKNNYLSESWKETIIENYFDTFEKSKIISEGMKSTHYEKPLFIGFFQPFVENINPYELNNKDKNIVEITNKIREKIKNYDYIFDVHDAYNNLKKEEIMDDICHVHGEAHVVMSKIIADIIYNELKSQTKE